MPKKIKKKRNQVSCQLMPKTNKIILETQKRFKKKHGVSISKCESIHELVRLGYETWTDIK